MSVAIMHQTNIRQSNYRIRRILSIRDMSLEDGMIIKN